MNPDLQELLDLAEEAQDILREFEPGSDEYTLSWQIEIARRHLEEKPCGLRSCCPREKCQEV